MAVYSYQYTLYNCSPTGLKVNSKYWHGRKRVMFASANVTGILPGNATAENSRVYLGRVLAGTMVVGGRLYWESAGGTGLGTASQVTVGDLFDCDRFLALTNTAGNSEGNFGTCGLFMTLDNNAIPMNAQYLNVEYTGIGYEYTCDADIILTAVNGPAAGLTGHVRCVLDYVTE